MARRYGAKFVNENRRLSRELKRRAISTLEMFRGECSVEVLIDMTSWRLSWINIKRKSQHSRGRKLKTKGIPILIEGNGSSLSQKGTPKITRAEKLPLKSGCTDASRGTSLRTSSRPRRFTTEDYMRRGWRPGLAICPAMPLTPVRPWDRP